MAAGEPSVQAPAGLCHPPTRNGMSARVDSAARPSREPTDSRGQRVARGLRFDLRDRGRDVTALARFAGCGRHRRPGAEGVTVKLSEDGRASYGDVQMCALIWACPVCSAKIRQERAQRIEAAALRHTDQGGGLAFGTLTVPHDFGDDLAKTLTAVRETWRKTRENRAVRRLWKRLGLRGYVRSIETPYGRNGWHPHIHVLWFTTRPLTAAELVELGDVVHAAWATGAQSLGLRMPTREHGVRVQGIDQSGRGASALAGYLAKVQDAYGDTRSVGSEMTRGDLKRGRKQSRTPFELLDQAAAGNVRARRLWREYERVTAGVRCIEASRGLLAGLDVDDVTDEEAAAAVDDAPVVVLVLRDVQWQAVLRETYGRRRLLELVEDQGVAAARVWLDAITYVRQPDHVHRGVPL